MLIVEIDAVGPETFQRFIDDPPDALRPAVQAVRAIDLEAELRGDGDLVADRRERLTDEFLVDVGSVNFRGVEECDAAFIGIANHPNALGPVHTGTVVAAAEPHAAEAKLRHLQTAELSGFQFAAHREFRGLRSRGARPRCCGDWQSQPGSGSAGHFKEVASAGGHAVVFIGGLATAVGLLPRLPCRFVMFLFHI